MSEHYTVLARRYRPQTFDDVVGQSHVGTALRNAIASDRIAHAYLFTGARGVGKTSTARIFAKALNCPNVEDGRPCNACEVCDAIGAGSDVDVLEIDGASNRGIDDVRQLRANVGIRPMRSPRKVYIVDEVHMLTKEAFNALLKTLEEPPPNVNFVFCTTEPQKVPDTILSRCQRFDFGTIEAGKITDRLTEIAAAEGQQVESEAVAMVARRAGGSMRDSQSLFDQLLAFGGDTITADDVHRLFGTAPDERIIEMVERLMGGDRAAALGMLDEAMTGGVRLDALSDQLVAYVRDLMVLAGGAAEAALMSVGESHRDALLDQANRWGLRTATAALQILSDAKLKMARTVHARPLFELALVRLTLLDDLDQIAALVATLRQNPSALAGIAAAGGAAGGSGKKKVPTAGVVAEARRPNAGSNGAAVSAPDSSASMKRALAEQSVAAGDERSAVDAESREVDTLSAEPKGDAAGEAHVVASSEATPSGRRVELTAETVDAFFAALLERLPPGLQTQLRPAKAVELPSAGLLRITLPGDNSMAKMNLTRPATRSQLATTATELAGRAIETELVFTAAQAQAAPRRPRQRREEQRRDNSVVDKNPFVQQVLEAFGGTVVQVTAQAAELSIPSDAYAASDDALLEDDTPSYRDDDDV